MVRRDWPIIVGGCFRSGTSLVRRILNAHPRIHCGPEVHFFRDFFGDYFSDPVKHLRFASSARSILPETELLEILGRAFIAIHEHSAIHQGKARWADKNPDNSRYLDQWQRLLGDDWLFIQVVRNPLDTLASMKGRFPLTLPSNLEAQIRLYLDLHGSGLEFARRYPDRYVRIRYEELVSAPRDQISILMSRLGESSQSQQLTFNGTDHEIGLEDPKIRLTDKIDRTRIDQWKHVLTDKEAKDIQIATAQIWEALNQDGG